MILTPSNTGNLVAGAGLGIFAWSAFLKADKIPWLKKLLTTRRKEVTLDWIDKNKGISLLGLESNQSRHPRHPLRERRHFCAGQYHPQHLHALGISAVPHGARRKEARSQRAERSCMTKLTLLAVLGLIYIGVSGSPTSPYPCSSFCSSECRYGS